MSRLVNADALLEKAWDADTRVGYVQVVDVGDILDAPTIDAVPVVRCRDCKWYEIYQLKKDGTDDRRYRPSYCTSLAYHTRPDWYCADGERREDEK